MDEQCIDDVSVEKTENEIQRQQDIESKKHDYLIKMDKLYDKVLQEFVMGKSTIYNPSILSHITRDKFIDWIIDNNYELSNLFRNNR